jgi:hypothetical protein
VDVTKFIYVFYFSDASLNTKLPIVLSFIYDS